MARYGYGMSVSGSRTAVVASSGEAPITTSRAFNSSGVQVGSTITGNIPTDWLVNDTTVTSVVFANDNSVTSIGNYAFQGTSLTSITIPNSVTNMGDYAFYACSNLAVVTLPTNINFTSIGTYAFQDCASLTSITIPNSVTSIGNYAFQGAGLTSVTIPNSVTSIANYAFRDCTSLSSVTFTATSSVTSIGSYAFAYTGLTSITIPNSVLTIGGGVFNGCANLATVLCRVPQSAFTGSNAFSDTASPLVIQARITDTSWTAGTGLTFQGNTNVTVIKNL